MYAYAPQPFYRHNAHHDHHDMSNESFNMTHEDPCSQYANNKELYKMCENIVSETIVPLMKGTLNKDKSPQ